MTGKDGKLKKSELQAVLDSSDLSEFGSPGWTRTNDNAINSRGLYRLSY